MNLGQRPLKWDDIPAPDIEEEDLAEVAGEFRIAQARPPAPVALESRRRVAAGFVVFAPDEDRIPIDDHVLGVVVAVPRVGRVGRRHHENRYAAPVEGTRDRPLLPWYPADRPSFEEDGDGDAPFAGAYEILRHNRIGELVDVHQDLVLCRRYYLREDLIRTVRGDERCHRHIFENRRLKPGLADEERAGIPDAVHQVVDLALTGVDVGRPGDLLDERRPMVEVELIGRIREKEVSAAHDDVRHGRRVILDLEVRQVAMCLFERDAISCDHQPAAYPGSRRKPKPTLTVGYDVSIEQSLSLEHQVLIGVAGQVGVRAELGDHDASGRAGKEAEEQYGRGDPAHTQGYVSPGLIEERL